MHEDHQRFLGAVQSDIQCCSRIMVADRGAGHVCEKVARGDSGEKEIDFYHCRCHYMV